MAEKKTALYEDAKIRCDSDGLTIRCYYLWGAKRIRFASIRGVERMPLSGSNAVRRWRLWGSGDFRHWWNLDPRRPEKRVALVLDVGRRIRPTITPEDPSAVERILQERIARS